MTDTCTPFVLVRLASTEFLGQQVPDGRGRHIPHHGGRHHDREDHPHDGVLRPEDPLKAVDKGDDEHKVQGRRGEIRPDVLK